MVVVWLSPKSFGTDAAAQETTAERRAQRRAERPSRCGSVSGRGETWYMGMQVSVRSAQDGDVRRHLYCDNSFVKIAVLNSLC